jgi:hypothetical protein
LAVESPVVIVIYNNERNVLCTLGTFNGSGMPKIVVTSIQKWDTGFSDGIPVLPEL